MTLVDLRDSGGALRELARAQEMVKQVENVDRIAEARIHNAMGQVHLLVHEFDEAMTKFHKALAVMQRLHGQHLTSALCSVMFYASGDSANARVAIYYLNIGFCYLLQGCSRYG